MDVSINYKFFYPAIFFSQNLLGNINNGLGHQQDGTILKYKDYTSYDQNNFSKAVMI